MEMSGVMDDKCRMKVDDNVAVQKVQARLVGKKASYSELDYQYEAGWRS